MRLLIVTNVPFMLPPIEAYAKQIWILARELSEKGIQCEILSLSRFSTSTREIAKNCGISLSYIPSSLSPVEIISKRNEFDVVHLFAPMGKAISYACMASELLNKIRKIPIIFTVYNSECNHFWQDQFMGIPLVHIFSLLNNFAIFSQKQFDILKHFLPSANIFFLPPLTDRSPYRQPTKRSSMPSILYLGDFAEHKGVFDLLSAFKIVLETYAEAKLVLCIRGVRYSEEQQKAGQYVERKGLAENIIIKGVVNPWQELSTAWVYVYPFRGSPKVAAPAIPLTLIEATKVRTPIVATRTGAICEFFPDDVLVNPGSSESLCEKILMQLDKKRSRVPKLPASFLDTDEVIKQYQTVYESICKQ